jgi:hypothetical protein
MPRSVVASPTFAAHPFHVPIAFLRAIPSAVLIPLLFLTRARERSG